MGKSKQGAKPKKSVEEEEEFFEFDEDDADLNDSFVVDDDIVEFEDSASSNDDESDLSPPVRKPVQREFQKKTKSTSKPKKNSKRGAEKEPIMLDEYTDEDEDIIDLTQVSYATRTRSSKQSRSSKKNHVSKHKEKRDEEAKKFLEQRRLDEVSGVFTHYANLYGWLKPENRDFFLRRIENARLQPVAKEAPPSTIEALSEEFLETPSREALEVPSERVLEAEDATMDAPVVQALKDDLPLLKSERRIDVEEVETLQEDQEAIQSEDLPAVEEQVQAETKEAQVMEPLNEMEEEEFDDAPTILTNVQDSLQQDEEEPRKSYVPFDDLLEELRSELASQTLEDSQVQLEAVAEAEEESEQEPRETLEEIEEEEYVADPELAEDNQESEGEPAKELVEEVGEKSQPQEDDNDHIEQQAEIELDEEDARSPSQPIDTPNQTVEEPADAEVMELLKAADELDDLVNGMGALGFEDVEDLPQEQEEPQQEIFEIDQEEQSEDEDDMEENSEEQYEDYYYEDVVEEIEKEADYESQVLLSQLVQMGLFESINPTAQEARKSIVPTNNPTRRKSQASRKIEARKSELPRKSINKAIVNQAVKSADPDELDLEEPVAIRKAPFKRLKKRVIIDSDEEELEVKTTKPVNSTDEKPTAAEVIEEVPVNSKPLSRKSILPNYNSDPDSEQEPANTFLADEAAEDQDSDSQSSEAEEADEDEEEDSQSGEEEPSDADSCNSDSETDKSGSDEKEVEVVKTPVKRPANPVQSLAALLATAMLNTKKGSNKNGLPATNKENIAPSNKPLIIGKTISKPKEGLKTPVSSSKGIQLKRKPSDLLPGPLISGRKFQTQRPQLTSEYYQLLNKYAFDNKLPPDLPINWKTTLLTTAGTYNHRERCISLAKKVCDDSTRLVETLAHEMCHAAVAIVDNRPTEHHGKAFKWWGRKVTTAFPRIEVGRCHSYQIKYKYVYRCDGCGCEEKRQSKSIKAPNNICYCGGTLLLDQQGPPRTPSKFSLFVKDNFAEVKKQNPATPHKDLMAKLSQKWKETQNPKEVGCS